MNPKIIAAGRKNSIISLFVALFTFFGGRETLGGLKEFGKALLTLSLPYARQSYLELKTGSILMILRDVLIVSAKFNSLASIWWFLRAMMFVLHFWSPWMAGEDVPMKPSELLMILLLQPGGMSLRRQYPKL